ncbi:Protein CHUP1, chloroplastic [Ananas comosus]|uniref:Protein CHUP1, chloroplastic n=1 Tax=Ananas comosus TaxID=4615 RepID=A0A199VY21_ANACO|nr:Protein CHUP1, chloroplastic [Ananas comosus]
MSFLDRKMTREENTCTDSLRSKLDAMVARSRGLEKENELLKQEVEHLKAQMALLRGQEADRRSMPSKKLQSAICSNFSTQEKPTIHINVEEEGSENEGFNSYSKKEISMRRRTPRVPKPPPTPICLPPKPNIGKEAWLPPPPPPPPPFALKPQGGGIKALRRVPELVELYRTLTRKEGKADVRAGNMGSPVATNTREMIGEIENRSAYLLAIKSDVETQGEFINFLAKEIENAAYKDIADVEAFVKWLDEELSYLVDERAVLKHFAQWPERKADAMREAAFGFRDLKSLESEVSSFHDDERLPAMVSLKRMQALQDKLERSVHNIERVRDTAIRRYKDFKIPWEWMLDTGMIAQLKLGSMKLVKEYMIRVVTAVKSDSSLDDEELTLQGVRFAFRVHQFINGFDEDGRHAFRELKKLATKS